MFFAKHAEIFLSSCSFHHWSPRLKHLISSSYSHVLLPSLCFGPRRLSTLAQHDQCSCNGWWVLSASQLVYLSISFIYLYMLYIARGSRCRMYIISCFPWCSPEGLWYIYKSTILLIWLVFCLRVWLMFIDQYILDLAHRPPAWPWWFYSRNRCGNVGVTKTNGKNGLQGFMTPIPRWPLMGVITPFITSRGPFCRCKTRVIGSTLDLLCFDEGSWVSLFIK